MSITSSGVWYSVKGAEIRPTPSEWWACTLSRLFSLMIKNITLWRWQWRYLNYCSLYPVWLPLGLRVNVYFLRQWHHGVRYHAKKTLAKLFQFVRRSQEALESEEQEISWMTFPAYQEDTNDSSATRPSWRAWICKPWVVRFGVKSDLTSAQSQIFTKCLVKIRLVPESPIANHNY
jgi:hypothetical protein